MRPGRILRLVLQSFFKKPVTRNYPVVKIEMPQGFRGKLKFDPKKCVGCKMCMRDCPAGAITISKTADNKFMAEIDLARCIFCAQCVDSCMRKALEMTKEFELGALKKHDLTVVTKDESQGGT